MQVGKESAGIDRQTLTGESVLGLNVICLKSNISFIIQKTKESDITAGKVHQSISHKTEECLQRTGRNQLG